MPEVYMNLPLKKDIQLVIQSVNFIQEEKENKDFIKETDKK
jgi:hypothetical protein